MPVGEGHSGRFGTRPNSALWPTWQVSGDRKEEIRGRPSDLLELGAEGVHLDCLVVYFSWRLGPRYGQGSVCCGLGVV